MITGEDGPVMFGLNMELLLLGLIPLWLFLGSLLPVLALLGLGVLGGELFYPALLVTGLICHMFILPLGASLAHRVGKRRREISDDRLSHFASRVVELYAVAHRNSQVASDPRAAQAFRLYILAGEELRENPHRLNQETWRKISRGTYLAERALAGDSVTHPNADSPSDTQSSRDPSREQR